MSVENGGGSLAFDYVIVGGGTAGCVLANRLTASGRHSVLLLEAGGSDKRLWIQMPIGYGKSFYDPNVNWKFETEPVPGLADRRIYWPRGKVLGGSSSINAMVFIRGQPSDFDDWERAGNPGWGWTDVLPYFRKLEHNEAGADEWRAVGGPLHVSDISKKAHPICRRFISAGIEAGLPHNHDFNGHTMEGVGYYQINTRDGLRMSTARAYLDPARRRPNLTIKTEATATRILFEGLRATGVEFSRRGRKTTARAGREVILAAGAINSPALLQASGIGPADLLASLAIPVVHPNSAVGSNLQDHLSLRQVFKSRIPTLNRDLRPLTGKLIAGLQYIPFRRGPLSLSVNHAGGFIRSSTANQPDIQLYFQPMSYTTAPPGKRPLMSPDSFQGFLMSIAPSRPKSRGWISIRSLDPTAQPRIQPNSFADERDLETMIEGFEFLRQLARMPTLADIIEAEITPGDGVKSREDIVEYIRTNASTVFHPCCTCRMGPADGSNVVDATLRAHGLEALRVADASIFPNVTSGNTNAPVVMVAEKAADLILQSAS